MNSIPSSKQCGKCKKLLNFNEFHKSKLRKFGLNYWCKKCIYVYRKCREKEPGYKEKEHAKHKVYRESTQGKKTLELYTKSGKLAKVHIKAHRKYTKTHPWYKTLSHIKQRCNNPKTSSYKSYGGKGVKCKITLQELKELWIEYGADLMKNPSISRRNETDPEKFHYTKDNCFYEELADNIARSYRRRRK